MILRPANSWFVWGALAAGLACAHVAAQMLPPPVDPGVVEIEVTAAGETRWIDADYVPHQVGSLRSVLYRKTEHWIHAESEVSYLELDANYEFTPEEGKPVRFTDPDSFTLNWKGGPNVVDYRLNFRGTGILGLREFAVTRQDGTKDFEVDAFISNQAYTMTLAGRDVFAATVLRPFREAGITSKTGPNVVSSSPRFQNRPWGWKAIYSESNGWRNILPHAFRGGLAIEGRDSTSFQAYRYQWINNRYFQESFGTVTINHTGGSYTRTPIPLQPAAATATLGTKDWTFVGEPDSGPDPTAHFAFSPEAASASKLHYQLSLDPGLARKIVWAEVFTPEGADAPTDYRFKSEYVSAEATKTASHLLDPFSWRGSEPGTYTLLTFDGALAVDFNRDGVILTAANPLTPHLIDNADQPDPDRGVFLAPNLIDNDGDQINDATDNKVNGPDDLAEFIPVYLDLKHLVAALPPGNGFAYKLKHADAAMNFVFTNLMWSNAHTYQDGLGSGFGPDLSQPAWEAEVTQITPGGVDIFAAPTGSTAFLDMIRNQSGGVILVEARQTTRAPLVLTVEKNGQVIVELQLQFEVVGPSLSVDLNRDGVIKTASEDATDTTSAANPYRFWLNDDDDGTESFGSSDDSDRVPVQQADWTNHLIDCARDLEDFARLQIYTAGLNDALKNGDLHLGLKWTAVTGTPAIKLYKHVEAGGGTGYLTDQAIAHREYAERGVANNLPLNDASGQHSDYLVEGAATFVLPPALFADITETQPKTHLLFEGCKAGKGYLKLVILKKDDANYTEIGEGPSVWVELRSIKSMYQGPGTTFEQPAGETAQGIIFVHGWNMSPEGSVSFAETMFKRLWHRGFKGRYVSLRWNTNYSDAFDHLPVIGAAVDGYLADYNGSERVAWQSGAIVKAAVDGLPSGYSRNIVAHSMGNIIAGSALLAGVTFDNYVLMQAAVPASCYDDRALLQQAERPSPHTYLGFRPTFWEVDASPDDDPVPETRALSYRGRLGGDRGNLVSFYLPDDASTTYAWEFNNDQFKPAATYGYTRGAGVFMGTQLGLWKRIGSFQVGLNDPLEAMPLACRSWSKLVGAESRTAGAIQGSVDLSRETFSLPGATLGFREEHSAQFNRSIQVLKPFYDALLNRFDIDPTP